MSNRRPWSQIACNFLTIQHKKLSIQRLRKRKLASLGMSILEVHAAFLLVTLAEIVYIGLQPLIIYNQMGPSSAKCYTRSEAEKLPLDGKFENVRIHPIVTDI